MKPVHVAAMLLEDDADRADSDPPLRQPEPEPADTADDFDPKDLAFRYTDERAAEIAAKQAAGVIDRQTISKLGYGKTIYHKHYLNADGTAARAVIKGAIKTWVTRPDEFRIPWKHGFRTYGYVTQREAEDWSTTEPEPVPAKEMRVRRQTMGRNWSDRRYKRQTHLRIGEL